MHWPPIQVWSLNSSFVYPWMVKKQLWFRQNEKLIVKSSNEEVVSFDFQKSWMVQRLLPQWRVPFFRCWLGPCLRSPKTHPVYIRRAQTDHRHSQTSVRGWVSPLFPPAYCAFTHHLNSSVLPQATSTHKPLSHHAEGLPTGADLSCVCSGGRRKLNIRVTHISCAHVS